MMMMVCTTLILQLYAYLNVISFSIEKRLGCLYVRSDEHGDL